MAHILKVAETMAALPDFFIEAEFRRSTLGGPPTL